MEFIDNPQLGHKYLKLPVFLVLGSYVFDPLFGNTRIQVLCGQRSLFLG